jgi:hypothetical protein
MVLRNVGTAGLDQYARVLTLSKYHGNNMNGLPTDWPGGTDWTKTHTALLNMNAATDNVDWAHDNFNKTVACTCHSFNDKAIVVELVYYQQEHKLEIFWNSMRPYSVFMDLGNYKTAGADRLNNQLRYIRMFNDIGSGGRINGEIAFMAASAQAEEKPSEILAALRDKYPY